MRKTKLSVDIHPSVCYTFKKSTKGDEMQKKRINWNLYRAYRDKDFTAKSLCEKTGIDYDRFCRLINGQLKKWRKKEMQKLSKILRQPQKHLFQEEE